MLSEVPSSAKPSTTLSRTSCRRSRAFCGFPRHRASQTPCSYRCSARSRHRTRTSGYRFWSPIGLSTLSLRGSIWCFASAHFEIHRWSLGKSLPIGISWLRALLILKGPKFRDLQRICSITTCPRSRIGELTTAGPFGTKTERSGNAVVWTVSIDERLHRPHGRFVGRCRHRRSPACGATRGDPRRAAC
jgi:hypothetical protein